MKRSELDSGHVESAVGVMRTLVHFVQIMQRREVAKHSPKPGRTEWKKQSTNNNGGSHETLIGIAIVSVLLSGCFAKAGRTSGVNYGMSKQEVVAVMGAPVRVSTQGNSQSLSFSVCDTDNQTLSGIMRPYVVRLIDRRVESYGTTDDVGAHKRQLVATKAIR